LDLRFGCEKIGHALSSPGGSRYWLTGLCSLHVDDRFGPPPEWNLFDIPFLSAVQKIPLVAHVNVIPDGEWEKRFAVGDRGWPSNWLKDPQGNTLPPDFVQSLYAAFAKAAKDASVMVFYVEPDPEYLSVFDSRDAKVFITLRMTEAQILDWTNLGRKFLGTLPPPCSLTVDDIYFTISDSASALTGHPTWQRFVEGQAYAMSESYELKVAASWDDIEFNR
jgi:hypothetical protein